jgi:hypothetical protein
LAVVTFRVTKSSIERPGPFCYWSFVTLPNPLSGPPPSRIKLSPTQWAAILDDDAVVLLVRHAVLFELEMAFDPGGSFRAICLEEELRGTQFAAGAELQVGRAMTLNSFERGLADGWFGAAGLGYPLARRLIRRLKKDLAADPSGISALRTIRRDLAPDFTASPLARRVTWYYFDQANIAAPLKSADASLALRLALPAAMEKPPPPRSNVEYIVLAFGLESLENPRRPRFTDCGELYYLDFWRPGGLTNSKAVGLTGLDELVEYPLVLAPDAIGVSIVECDHI